MGTIKPQPTLPIPPQANPSLLAKASQHTMKDGR
jgi:hypothetical protein